MKQIRKTHISQRQGDVGHLAHEGFHDVDQKAMQAIKDRQEGRPNKYDVEDPAYEIQRDVLEEIEGKR